MTVQELIDLLQALPNKQALIMTEGCDCYGEPKAVEELGENYLISRTED